MRINLYSDTQTAPSADMRKAMAEAEVGDEQSGADPTVNALCERVAGLLGKEAAVFLPSGTMCNEIAMMIHCRPGDEIIAHETAHVITAEGGGPAALAHAMVRPVYGANGQFDAADVHAAVRAPSRYRPVSRLLVVEQTSNFGGGAVWPAARIEAVADAARKHGLVVHMDGARLMNAVVASNVNAETFAAPCDTVWLDLTKGLGCPVGAVLAGSRDFIEAAWVWKQRIGGAMRQAGIIAAAGLYALDHNVERLAEDHANARALVTALCDHPAVDFGDYTAETNIVFFNVKLANHTAGDVVRLAGERGLRIGAFTDTLIRAVTHHDVSADEVGEGAYIIRGVLDQLNA